MVCNLTMNISTESLKRLEASNLLSLFCLTQKDNAMVNMKFLYAGFLALFISNLQFCSQHRHGQPNKAPSANQAHDPSVFPTFQSYLRTHTPATTQQGSQQSALTAVSIDKITPPGQSGTQVDDDTEDYEAARRAARSNPTARAPEEMLGQPFPDADLGKQENPQIAGILGYDLTPFGLMTASDYLAKILDTGCARDAFARNGADGGFKNPKIRERATQAIAADMSNLRTQTKELLVNISDFKEAEQATLAAFLAAREERFGAFIKAQRSKFMNAINPVDRLISMFATIEGAKGVAGEALIQDEYNSLSAIRTALESGLNGLQRDSVISLRGLAKRSQADEQLQADELHAQLVKIDRMLGNIQALHPKPETLPKPTKLQPYQTIDQLQNRR